MKKLLAILFGCLLISCSSFADTTIPVDGTLAEFFAGIHEVHLTEAQTDVIGATKYLVIGDSISYGTGAEPLTRGFACVASAVMMVNNPGSTYYNASIGGRTSRDGIAMLNSCPFVPDVIIVNFGMNDGAYITTEEYRINMTAIIARAKEINPDVKILLCSPIIPGISIYHNLTTIHKFPVMENILFDIAEANTNVFVVPLTSYSAVLINAGCTPAGYTTDTVHPTVTMHQLMAIEVCKTVGLLK